MHKSSVTGIALATLVMVAVTGCEAIQSNPKAAIGAAGGAALSGLIAAAGTTVAWQNPDIGHSGAVTPSRTYQTTSGTYCREYQQSMTMGGKPEQVRGTARRPPDGRWKAVN